MVAIFSSPHIRNIFVLPFEITIYIHIQSWSPIQIQSTSNPDGIFAVSMQCFPVQQWIMFDIILLGMSLRLAVPTVPSRNDRVAVWHHDAVGSVLTPAWNDDWPALLSLIQVRLDFGWFCLFTWPFVKYNSGLFHPNVIWDMPSANLALTTRLERVAGPIWNSPDSVVSD